MKPSHYHYIKRMWVRNSYKRRNEKKKSLLTLPFRMIIFPYSVTFKTLRFGVRKANQLANALPEISITNNKSRPHLYGSKDAHPKIDAYLMIVLGIDMAIIGLATLALDTFFIFSLIIIFAASLIFFFGCFKLKSLSEEQPKSETQEINLPSIDDIKPTEIPNEHMPDKITSQNNSRTKMSRYEIERYAVMCNAYLEHEEEMEQYSKNESLDEM
ncbi:MAG: hypothetical protein ACOX8K_10825 [Lachnospiraceae bacterium]|jgi:hypothetical protein